MISREEIITLVLKYEGLLDARDMAHLKNSVEGNWDECEACDTALEEFLREYPNIMNYDDLGNYIGRVMNEDGWTP